MLARRRFGPLALVTWLSVIAFVALEAVAMSVYPGGSWFDRSTVGYSFRQNFFCDLTASTALNGAPSPSAVFARVAMIVLAFGMMPFWWSLAEVCDGHARSVVRAAGVASSVASMTVPFLSTHEVGALHGVAAMTAGSFGLIAAAVGVVSAFRNRALLIGALGASSFATALVVSGIYLPALIHHTDAPSLPLAQKPAAIVLLVWMLTTVLVARRPPSIRHAPVDIADAAE